MIDEVMYGMMPSAKIVRRRRLPPLKRSKMPRNEPAPCWKMVSSTRQLMPGVGMCAPMRYTASKASVNSTRFRKSGMRKRFLKASKNRFMRLRYFLVPYLSSVANLGHNLERSARCTDLFLRRRAKGVRVNGELGGQFTVAEDLDAVGLAANEAMCAEQIWRYRFACWKDVELFQVKDRVGDAERIME